MQHMAKPVVLAVDDDPDVLRSVERDLRKRYGALFRVMRADSGASALDALAQLKARNEPVALLLSDQRMPTMNGVEFLQQARTIYPDAKRALLTAYADTDAAIKAINGARIDYYLSKPWEPPEEHLYPVLQDLLDDWQAGYRPAFDGLRVIGHRWSPDTHAIKDFLARNHVPYRWLDVENDAEAQQLRTSAPDQTLPLVVFPDGATLNNPSTSALAERAGFKTRAADKFYDVVIVGGGPSGLAAAVYATSEGLRTLMIEREAPGGQAGMSSRIENYLGFPVGLSGADLARRALTQATRFGAEILTAQQATALGVDGPARVVTLADGATVSARAIIVATGVQYRTFDAPGVERLRGAGIYYGAAMTEALSCQNQHVFIVGGANSAGQAAMYFSRYAGKVSMLVRGPGLAESMSQYLIDQIAATPNIDVRTFTQVAEAHGTDRLEALTLKHAKTGATEQLDAAALFIFIGAVPRTDWLAGVIARDDKGFLLTGAQIHDKTWPLARAPFSLETNIPGIFAVGDVRQASMKRVAAAVGEGSMAVSFVHQYLAEL
jgi:thioredoxin reductase (NADPH)